MHINSNFLLFKGGFMNFDIWISFIIATAIVTILPGPTMLLIMSHAMTYGSKKTLNTVSGVILADCILLLLSLMGIGIVLYSSAVAFNTMKWFGVVYLIYLGIKQYQIKAIESDVTVTAEKDKNGKNMFLEGFLVTVLNPKLIGFFLAFSPQFISQESPMFGQLIVLIPTFLLIVFIVLCGYFLLAEQMKKLINLPKTTEILNKISGSTLIGAGLITATLEK